MTGDADYLIRVVVADIQVLEEFILKFLTKLPGSGRHQVELCAEAG